MITGFSAKRFLAVPMILWLMVSASLGRLQTETHHDTITPQWELCKTNCVPGPKLVHVEMDYWKLESLAVNGAHGLFMYDIEPWKLTPLQQRMSPLYWICRAAQLQVLDPGMRLIIAPYAVDGNGRTDGAQMNAEEKEAARCGAYAVDLQAQAYNAQPVFPSRKGNETFAQFVHNGIAGIRSVNKRTIILVGLATNTGGVIFTVNELLADYYIALLEGANGFWMNIPEWPAAAAQCAAKYVDAFCSGIAIQFFNAIGRG